MTIDLRTPALVAMGEITGRSDTIADPIELAAEATRPALADAMAPIQSGRGLVLVWGNPVKMATSGKRGSE